MTLEEIKQAVVEKRDSGATWTDIALWIEQTHGLSVHRTTVQRWYDKQLEDEETLLDDAAKLATDKKLVTAQGESKLYKKLYQQVLRELAKKDLLVRSINELTPSITPRELIHSPQPKSKHRGSSSQIAVAPLTDTHIGEYVDIKQMAGINQYHFEIFNRRLY